MAYIEGLKERIGWLKAVFATLLVTEFSLIGWLAQKFLESRGFSNVEPVEFNLSVRIGIIIAGIAVIGFAGVVIYCHILANKKIDEIYELENL